MKERSEFVSALKSGISNEPENNEPENEEQLLKDLLKKKYEEYAKIYENKNVQDYFHYVIAAVISASTL